MPSIRSAAALLILQKKEEPILLYTFIQWYVLQYVYIHLSRTMHAYRFSFSLSLGVCQYVSSFYNQFVNEMNSLFRL
jgi:hypothetical protein